MRSTIELIYRTCIRHTPRIHPVSVCLSHLFHLNVYLNVNKLVIVYETPRSPVNRVIGTPIFIMKIMLNDHERALSEICFGSMKYCRLIGLPWQLYMNFRPTILFLVLKTYENFGSRANRIFTWIRMRDTQNRLGKRNINQKQRFSMATNFTGAHISVSLL